MSNLKLPRTIDIQIINVLPGYLLSNVPHVEVAALSMTHLFSIPRCFTLIKYRRRECEWAIDLVNEWLIDLMSEWTSEWLSEWASDWFIKRLIEWQTDWLINGWSPVHIFTKCLKVASAMGDLQMFPRHTNSTDLFPAAAMSVSSQFTAKRLSHWFTIESLKLVFKSNSNLRETYNRIEWK